MQESIAYWYRGRYRCPCRPILLPEQCLLDEDKNEREKKIERSI